MTYYLSLMGLYVTGLGLLGAGVAMFIRMFVMSRRPRIYDARILDIFKDYWEHPGYPGQLSPRKFRLAKVEYYYKSIKYEFTIILKSKRSRPGDSIILTINPKNPKLSEQVYIKPEIVAGIILVVLGGGILIATYILQSYLLSIGFIR